MTREEAIEFIAQSVKSDVDMAKVADAIKALEQEPRKGYWIKYDKEFFSTDRMKPVVHSIRECSECHTRIADFCGEMKYCPSCTAKMEGIMEE